MDPSAALEARVRELASHLERHSEHIQRLRVVIEPPSAHHRAGQFDVTLEISVPGEEIAVRTEHRDEPSHQDAYAAVNDAFHTARRRLEEYESKRHLDVKAHSRPKQPG
jgi:ribosome-associated translation inhibitor RaiA